MQPKLSSCGGLSNDLANLIEQLANIRSEMLTLEKEFSQEISYVHSVHRDSARNLLHYMALRRHDLRQLQTKLASYGLSSLGRSESQVSANLDAVLKALCCIAQQPFDDFEYDFSQFASGKSLLHKNSAALLGPAPQGRTVRIMVTMPSEAASDYVMVRDLVKSGMNCMRINGAHDNEDMWAHMVENLRRAEREVGLQVKVLMDLPGPKLRTGPTESVPGVIKVQPKRDRLGNVIEPAKVWLTPTESPQAPTSDINAVLTVPKDWLSYTEPGSEDQISRRTRKGTIIQSFHGGERKSTRRIRADLLRDIGDDAARVQKWALKEMPNWRDPAAASANYSESRRRASFIAHPRHRLCSPAR